jgi:hypothetical protein
MAKMMSKATVVGLPRGEGQADEDVGGHGAGIKIPAKRVARFRVAKAMKDAVLRKKA